MLVTLVEDVSLVKVRLQCVIRLVGGVCRGTPVSSRERCHGAPLEGWMLITLDVVGHNVLGR